MGRLRAFHDDPSHDDLAIDELVANAARSSGHLIDVVAAAEGEELEPTPLVSKSAA